MKKAFKLAAIAIVAMAMATACGNNNQEPAVVDTPVADTQIDTCCAVDSCAMAENTEEAAAPVDEKKKATKKADKPVVNTDPAKVGNKAEINVSKDGLTVKKGNNSISKDGMKIEDNKVKVNITRN